MTDTQTLILMAYDNLGHAEVLDQDGEALGSRLELFERSIQLAQTAALIAIAEELRLARVEREYEQEREQLRGMPR